MFYLLLADLDFDAVETVTCPSPMSESLRRTKVEHAIEHSIPVPPSEDDVELSLLIRRQDMDTLGGQPGTDFPGLITPIGGAARIHATEDVIAARECLVDVEVRFAASDRAEHTHGGVLI